MIARPGELQGPGARRPAFHTTCTHDSDVIEYDETNPAWDFGWRFGHQDDFFITLLEGYGFHSRNWARVGQGGVWAHKVYKRTVQLGDGQSYTEDIELELRHVPQP